MLVTRQNSFSPPACGLINGIASLTEHVHLIYFLLISIVIRLKQYTSWSISRRPPRDLLCDIYCLLLGLFRYDEFLGNATGLMLPSHVHAPTIHIHIHIYICSSTDNHLCSTCYCFCFCAAYSAWVIRQQVVQRVYAIITLKLSSSLSGPVHRSLIGCTNYSNLNILLLSQDFTT